MSLISLKTEQGLIKLSIVGALFFGLLGTIWGLMIHSDAIIFDGFYSFLSTVLSIGSFYVSKLVLQKDNEKYHFGKSQIEPVFIVFRSVILITLCIYSIIISISSILEGGKDVVPGQAALYAIISVIGCLLVFFVLRSRGKHIKSEIVKVETTQWKVDTVLSLGVLVGFAVSLLVRDSKYQFIGSYIDPVLVIILCAVVVGAPLKSFTSNMKDLFMAAPNDSVEEDFNNIAAYIVKFYGFKEKKVRVVRTGRTYFVEINVLVDPSWKLTSIKDLDLIRNQFYSQVVKGDQQPWVTFSFTTEEKWL